MEIICKEQLLFFEVKKVIGLRGYKVLGLETKYSTV